MRFKITNLAFTLNEVIIVIIIIGILACFALPQFNRTIESAKAQEAVAALHQIRAGERIYRSKENFYWPAGAVEGDINTINTALRIFLDTRPERNWNYSVGANAVGNTFAATATRKGGGYNGRTITINQNGVLGGTWPLPIPGR
jgi:prepilin-type N-terminal cleavage/methylation domain-containing protein